MENVNRIFALPYNKKPDFNSKFLDSEYRNFVFEIYGTDGDFVSGRKAKYSQKIIDKFVRDLLDVNINFNYLLNALHFDDYIKTDIFDKLNYLRDIGVKTLTITHPFLVQEIQSKGYNFEINSSVNQFINSLKKAKSLIELQYDRIIVDEDEIRNLALIKDICTNINKPVEVLINNACLNGCPNRITHQLVDSSINSNLAKLGEIESFCYKNCWGSIKKDISFLLTSNWIRPIDLQKYLDLGVKIFKIAGRNYDTDSILQMLKIYSSKDYYNGNVLDYLKPNVNSESKYGFKELNESLLNEYFNEIWSKGKISEQLLIELTNQIKKNTIQNSI